MARAEFQSYYWVLESLGAPDLEAAQTVSKGRDSAHVLAAFEQLLTSSDVAARGVALDQYEHCEARGRFGLPNPFSQFAERALTEARTQLRHPAVKAMTPLSSVVIGANHASALGLLSHLGEPS